MLDVGMIVSGGVVVAIVLLADRWLNGTSRAETSMLDRLYLPVLVGVLFGRLVALALDDPTSLRSLRSILVIRGGVEFWPGVVAFGVVIATSAWRSGRAPGSDLAVLAPFALWGYGAYEATCVLRDGCFGPASTVGLAPRGLDERQLPLGLLMGLTCALVGFVVQRRSKSAAPPVTILAAIAGVASVRSIGSVWLPHLGSGPTRQHLQSTMVLAASLLALGAVSVAGGRAHRRGEPAGSTGRPTR